MADQSEIIFELYQKMAKQNIISAYHGDFTQAVVNMLLKQAKWDLTSRAVDKRTMKKTYSILVECLENILKHTTLLKASRSINENIDGIVILANDANNYRITIGNLVDCDDAPRLTSKIDYLNSLDKDGLKSHHTEVLKTGQISDKGGAGLGLIEVALKSGNKITYEFSDYSNDLSFFAMQVLISGNLNK